MNISIGKKIHCLIHNQRYRRLRLLLCIIENNRMSIENNQYRRWLDYKKRTLYINADCPWPLNTLTPRYFVDWAINRLTLPESVVKNKDGVVLITRLPKRLKTRNLSKKARPGIPYWLLVWGHFDPRGRRTTTFCPVFFFFALFRMVIVKLNIRK